MLNWNIPYTPPKSAIGFVYKITNVYTGEYYIGKRLIKKLKDGSWNTATKNYQGSGCFKQSNPDDLDKQILDFADSKSELSLIEANYIMQNLFDTDCRNEMINLRIRVSPKMKQKLNPQKIALGRLAK